ncbi:MAG: PepSY-associated TM helix domain-containing protein [Bacteroidales bacterium]|nr:PepSY-associated TM helix domain-containing protein [Bacteroidales bacterium]
MMDFKWRKWIRAIHRDLGYFFFALTVIYALSGIAINHVKEWNPNYIITNAEHRFTIPENASGLTREDVLAMLSGIGEEDNYKKHYYPFENQLKIFIDGGSVVIDLQTGFGVVEKIRRRPVFHLVNYIHYNPGKWWTTFSDFYAISLILIAFTGLFILKGSKGITARGAWLTAAGIIVPLIYILLFYK